MFPVRETYTHTAVTVVNKVTGMNINLALNIERNTVVEHIAEQIFVCLRGHKHKSVVGGFPTVENYDSPVAILRVNIVVVRARRSFRTDNLLTSSSSSGRLDGNTIISGV